MPDYKQGKIYKIVSNQTEDIYIGSTVQALSVRLACHRRDYKNYKDGKHTNVTSFDILKYGDAKIYLIEEYPCDNKEQLFAREGYYIKKLDCVNKQIAGRGKKQYHQDNKEQLNEKSKERYKNNREAILKRHKEYYEKHKEEKNRKQKEYAEKNKEKIKEYQKEYQLKNKEIIAKKEKEYRENNKEKRKEYIRNRNKIIYSCECGSEISIGTKAKHFRTQKHKEYIELNKN